MTTQRLFVAVDLPDPVKKQLNLLQTGITGAKWVNHEQMHITLRFIGDAAQEQTKRLQMGLAAIKAAPFSFHLQGVGQFPLKGRARVLWVGLTRVDAMVELQTQVERVVVNCGFEPADHPFSPHITLARFPSSPTTTEMNTYFHQHGTFVSDTILVSEFILFASQLTPRGPIYTRLLQVKLT